MKMQPQQSVDVHPVIEGNSIKCSHSKVQMCILLLKGIPTKCNHSKVQMCILLLKEIPTKCSHSKVSCLCWGFTAQWTQWGHVEHSQFTKSHLHWHSKVQMCILLLKEIPTKCSLSKEQMCIPFLKEFPTKCSHTQSKMQMCNIGKIHQMQSQQRAAVYSKIERKVPTNVAAIKCKWVW